MIDSLPMTDLSDGRPLEQEFRVARIICIGRNYKEHAREMGHDPEHEPPFFFFKPVTALARGGEFVIPSYSNEVHHELELVVALDSGGRDLDLARAQDCVSGFALGLDMTCRDSQRDAKQAGLPWDLAKGFDGSAPCTPVCPAIFAELNQLGQMTLTRNGNTVQQGSWRDMVWSVPELIAHISRHIELVPGDLIMTGTPAGVGPVQSGDVLSAAMEGFPHALTVRVH